MPLGAPSPRPCVMADEHPAAYRRCYDKASNASVCTFLTKFSVLQYMTSNSSQCARTESAGSEFADES